MSYRVSVGSAPVQRVKTVREAGVAVMEAVTGFLAQDPEAVARDAMRANTAIMDGVLQEALTAYGRWDMSVTVNGKEIPIAVVRKRLWLSSWNRTAYLPASHPGLLRALLRSFPPIQRGAP